MTADHLIGLDFGGMSIKGGAVRSMPRLGTVICERTHCANGGHASTHAYAQPTEQCSTKSAKKRKL